MEHDKKAFVDCARTKVRATPSDNLTLGERKEMKELQSYDVIVIINADKGNCTVLMDKTDYDKKMMKLLNDEATYKILNKHPVSALEKRLNAFVWKLRKNDKIAFSVYKILRSTNSMIPRICGLPKINKKEYLCAPLFLL